ncbi:MAG: undecaprenyl-diphosphate phosphatase [Lachnospiraceae bacterium]|nr:undecaprenyl-diphosphate phosphatase [Lachnospiraceae bacterium]
MELWKALVMGVIQGIAEFLPISSSGHLAIFKHILHLDLESGGMMFDILLHVGTLLAVFVVFYKDIWELIMEGIGIVIDFFKNVGRFFQNLLSKDKKEYIRIVDSEYRKFVMLVIVSTIPTGVIGYLGKDIIERAGQTLLIPGLCLLATAVLLVIADRFNQGTNKPDRISYSDAAIVGCSQGIATLPGLSRSGTTIAISLLLGFDKNFAVKYSFIMSIPAIMGAAVLDLKDIQAASLPAHVWFNYLAGTVVAAIVGYICIKTMLVIVRGKKFTFFSIYCFIVGIIAIVAYFLL